MSNYATGHAAEAVAAEYLKKQKYKIIELNWRTPRAEIDIVAWRKHEPLTFFEVKHRQTACQGSGLEYITPAKLTQMSFAAELWVQTHGYSGEYQLGAIELTGVDYQITRVIECIS